MTKALYSLPIVLALAACGVKSAEENNASQPTSRPDNIVHVETENLLGEPLPDEILINETAPAQARSDYSDVLSSKCTFKQGEGNIRYCDGKGGVRFYVKERSLRLSVDAGVLTDDFATMKQSNTLGGPVEWRIGDNGRPYAIIYRLRADASEAGPGNTMIFVKSVGTADKPGCTIAQIPGSTPNANDVAREKADGVLNGVACLKG